MLTPSRLAATFVALASLTASSFSTDAADAPLPAFDFTQPGVVAQWIRPHAIAKVAPAPDGMRLDIDGHDPYLHGPARDYPPDTPLWFIMRLRCDTAGTGSLFCYPATRYAVEQDRLLYYVPKAGQWVDVRVPLPALGPATRLRITPPGSSGQCTIARIAFQPRVIPAEPDWPKPQTPQVDASSPAIASSSGTLVLRHAASHFGAFVVDAAAKPVASGNNRPLIGYTKGSQTRWLDIAQSARATVVQEPGAVRVSAEFTDPDGARWTIRQSFTRSPDPDALEVETRVAVGEDRDVLYLPLLAVLPGAGSFGVKQDHALFAGLEYLDAPDTSSSEADLVGPQSQRQVPDTARITFPLMVVQAEGRYVGLIWDKQPDLCAVFDSPDRMFHSGGHLMGLLYPGSDGMNRAEGRLLPYQGLTLAAGKELVAQATLIGGPGESVIPAVQQYFRLRGLPPLPSPGVDKHSYVALAAGAWLDSDVSDGEGLFYHAFFPDNNRFQRHPAADAATWMIWLARATADPRLAARLDAAAAKALARVPPRDYDLATVSHVRARTSLLFGHVEENVLRARQVAQNLLKTFQPDGSVHYRQAPDKPDYGKTHFAPDANGLTATAVCRLLENACFAGDRHLIGEGLRVLRALSKFDNSTPRGAQTWECPLHSPDILASAYLVRAYTLGYELTGEKEFLDRAIAWAWTGVPFVYLADPVNEPVGRYATTPVLCATNWTAPNWIGLPVQWCGLVYSDALYRLLRHDPANLVIWKRLADGITVSGIQQSYAPSDTRQQGLLPDSFHLRNQLRHGPAINPGTLQASAVRLFGGPPLHDFRVFRSQGLLVHAPAEISAPLEDNGKLTFTVAGWSNLPYYVLISGFQTKPRVLINGQEPPLSSPHHFAGPEGRLTLRIEGSPSIDIRLLDPHAPHPLPQK